MTCLKRHHGVNTVESVRMMRLSGHNVSDECTCAGNRIKTLSPATPFFSKLFSYSPALCTPALLWPGYNC